ncbi:MAG: twin-arginine translocase TatA/TatE family subunit [Firmicutes bacterium]|nr:twin-arginine translocase TatA/TatE family subunit [Bacillota bacterium]
MFNIGPWELGLILLVALIVVGPGKLPEVAKAVGKGMNEFKKVTSGYKKEFQDAMDDMDKTVKSDSSAAPVVKPASNISEMADNFDAVVKAETVETVKVEVSDEAAPGK